MNAPRLEERFAKRRIGRRNRRGTATVEFAVTAPFLFALLLGMIDIGQFANVGQSVSGASALGARLAARVTTTSTDAVTAHVTDYLADRFPNLSDAELASVLQVNVLDSAGNTLSGTALDAVPSGMPVTVEVSFQFDAVRWLNGTGIGQGRTIQTTTVVRRE